MKSLFYTSNASDQHVVDHRAEDILGAGFYGVFYGL